MKLQRLDFATEMARPKRVHSIWAANFKLKKAKTVEGDGSNKENHCELTFIEQCWGYVKRLYRQKIRSSSEAALECNVVESLDAIPQSSMDGKFKFQPDRSSG